MELSRFFTRATILRVHSKVLLTGICLAASAVSADSPANAATRLAASLSSGKVQLRFEPNGFGYLRGLLDNLGINADTQVLVFSKTSFQSDRIGPENPRAIYFNEDVFVGFVPGGEVYEIIAVDPTNGLQFYTLSTHAQDKPALRQRGGDCLSCHASVNPAAPGLMIGSVYPGADGVPFTPGATAFSMTNQHTPFDNLWGGWYVTGTHGRQHHLGNAVAMDPTRPFDLQQDGTQNLSSLQNRFDTSRHIVPSSDIVALMTLNHQVQATNLMTSLNARTRGLISLDNLDRENRKAVEANIEALAVCLLYADAISLSDPIRGVSTFAETFPHAGPHDPEGRSLRDFDLKTRLFRYSLSYMIYSSAFNALNPQVKALVYRRLIDVLSEKDKSPAFSKVSSEDRKTALEILRATCRDLPE